MNGSWTFEYWSIGKVIAHRDEKGRFAKGHRHFSKEWRKSFHRPISQQSKARQEQFKNFVKASVKARRGKFKQICKLCGTPVRYRQRTKHLKEKHGLDGVKSKDYFVVRNERRKKNG